MMGLKHDYNSHESYQFLMVNTLYRVLVSIKKVYMSMLCINVTIAINYIIMYVLKNTV